MSDSYFTKVGNYYKSVGKDLCHNLFTKGIWIIFLSLLIIWFISGWLLYYLEKDLECSIINGLPDGLYCAWITMTTIGYGDFTPESVPGKIISCIDGFFGIILMGVIIWIVTVSLNQRETLNDD